MELTPRTRLLLRIQRWLFTLLFLCGVGLLGYLSSRHALSVDWTAGGRNTLSDASRALLERMPDEIRVRAFVSTDTRLRAAVRQLIDRYRRVHPRITLELVNPETSPGETERLQISGDGELVIEYDGQSERVLTLSERSLSGALARLAGRGERWIAYLSGHDGPDLLGERPTDLGTFGKHLQGRGFRVQPLRLVDVARVPDNVRLLIVALRGDALLSGELARIRAYLDRGGNLLWLAGPGARADDDPLAQLLGVRPAPGMIVDPSSELYGQSTPEFVIVPSYADHAVTRELRGFTVFPTATGLEWASVAGWRPQAVAASGLRSWRETGDLARAVRFDEPADEAGPLDLAVALERKPDAAATSQRAFVFGDADFLSNAYLGLGKNRDLGTNVVAWLSGEDAQLDVPVLMAGDLDFAPSRWARGVIALGPTVALPLLVLGAGLLRRRRRQRR